MKIQKRGTAAPGRGKNAKSAASLGSADALRLKRRIEAGDISKETLLDLLSAAQQACDLYDKACKGKKDNPNCLCGLIPAPGSSRRKGLWQKEPDALVSLGANPLDDKRQSSSTPSGLNNLGNTCYVNSALQCLFMIQAFREGLFAVDDPIADLPVITHIRRLFAELQEGPRGSADPTAFAESLNLDHSYQQDGQEFFKLLLNHLEGRLARSSIPVVRDIVPALFRGRYFYETKCLACGKLSEGSGRATNFYELDVQVKGMGSLETSLATLLGAEDMEGDNQFFCTFCQKKADARRQMKLVSMPPYLCISLQRFVFDMKKMAKVKASDKLSFPMKLDLAPLLGMDGMSPLQDRHYELMSILIHKGTSASHGHYVAHVWDEEAEKWWRFDDETVAEMPKGPVGERGDHGIGAEKKGGAPSTKGKRKPSAAVAGEDEVEVVGVVRRQGTPEEPLVLDADPADISTPPNQAVEENLQDRIASANAYMLVYRSKSLTGGARGTQRQLPAKLDALIAAERAAFVASCAEYEVKRAELMQKVQQQQASVRQVLESALLPGPEWESRWISADWLKQWADRGSTEPVKNDPLLCPHGKLDPAKKTEGKRITVEAWARLQEELGGGPVLADGDACRECLVQSLQGLADAQQGSMEREIVLQIVNTLTEEGEGQAQQPQPGDFYVSKSWLTGWRRRAKHTVSSMSPTQSITCRHGGLLPETASAKAKRIAVPPVVWEHLRISWRSAETAMPGKPGPSGTNSAADQRTEQLDKREAAVAAREQRVGGGMDSELLAETLQAMPNGHGKPGSMEGSEECLAARESILEMREAAVAAKEAASLGAEEAVMLFELPGPAESKPEDESTAQEAYQNGDGAAAQQDTCMVDADAADTAKRKCEPTSNGHAAEQQIDLCGDEDAVAEPGSSAPQEMREFRVSDANVCAVCLMELSADASTGQHLKEQAGAQRNVLAQLAASTSLHLELGGTYCLVPRPWLAAWRVFLGASGRRSSDAGQPPPPLPHAVADTFCTCHPADDSHPGCLSVKPPAVVKRRGRWAQASTETDTFEIINLADWEQLMVFYGEDSSVSEAHPARRPIRAKLVVDAPETAAEPSEAQAGEDDAPVAEGKKPSGRGSDDSARAHLDTEPDWCRQAVQEHKQAMRAAQLTYTDATFHVELVQPSDVSGSATIFNASGERRSKRMRRGKAMVMASALDTLWALKLRILEALDVHPRNAEVYCLASGKWAKLDNDEASLAELGVAQGQDIRVVHTGVVSDDDLTGVLGGPIETGSSGRHAAERGFAGTALVGL